ncbi:MULTISPECIES: urea ABC transporter permease subunit UrtB [unclassified Oceanobacter]|uniref:urea ABC transporter permease subunit UrtB n=1 Tax=unclassified Oceanobacter TaxID=2620260 RepID=UPI0027338E36|nr:MULTISPECIES: urea ABC transporter permease subunit UrtB [unclassified Oceanobacter]MDP2609799.1 urea ABC transporter permease subunit UrtB [Oceanobacter sp. 1_MG-2023]MDP2613130.1 urea ABC transporter permease subunit UrtB [Oceanobacter sp. 2_MG-2023]
MKKLFITCCCLLGMLAGPVFAELDDAVRAPDAETTPVAVEPSELTTVALEAGLDAEALAPVVTIESLLLELTETSLNKTIPVLEQLHDLGGKEILPLFKTLLAGDLYYVKATRQVVGKIETKGETEYKDPLTSVLVSDLGKRDVKKIRVNNRLRNYLNGVIARIRLSSERAEVRETAVKNLLSELDADTIVTIQAARQHETVASVQEIMDLALAMYQLESSTQQADQLAAIEAIGGSLEGDARNVLRYFADMATDHSDYNPVVSKAAAKALDRIQERVELYGFVDQLFFGLSLGSVLLLAAIGLAITFGVMGVINMAHGEMIMLGAYTTYVIQLIMPNLIDYSLWVAIPAAFIVSGLMGVLIERLVIRHLHGRPLETLLATFGISLILQQLVRTIFSPLNRQVASPEWMSGSVEINPVLSLTLNRLYILAFALLVFFALQLILKKTNLGLNVRAVSQNRSMARAMGVRSDRVDAMTFGLGSGIAGIAGVALSQLTNVGPNLGQAYIIDSFMVVVFGGVGNLLGTLVAAFSLGIANKFLEPVTGAVLASILVLVFIILFIQKRPKGLFPQKGRAAE